MSSLVSIIIPVYNHEKELKKSLASIACQSYKNVEIIVVDDGSDIPITYHVSRITYHVIRQPNQGAPSARNRGLAEANGEYVIFWDADIIARPDMLQKMHRSLQQHPTASYAYCDFRYGWKKMAARPFNAEALKQNNYIHTTSLIRRADLPNKPWDESLKRFQDWDVWLTLLKQHKTGIYIPECLFRAIPHHGGMSSWVPKFMYREPWRSLPLVRNKIEKYEHDRSIVEEKHGNSSHLDNTRQH